MYDGQGPIPSLTKTLIKMVYDQQSQHRRAGKKEDPRFPSRPWLHRKFNLGLSYLRQSQRAELYICAERTVWGGDHKRTPGFLYLAPKYFLWGWEGAGLTQL